jgi:hypothetical protein
MSRKSVLDIVREWARGTDEFTRDAEVDTITHIIVVSILNHRLQRVAKDY